MHVFTCLCAYLPTFCKFPGWNHITTERSGQNFTPRWSRDKERDQMWTILLKPFMIFIFIVAESLCISAWILLENAVSHTVGPTFLLSQERRTDPRGRTTPGGTEEGRGYPAREVWTRGCLCAAGGREVRQDEHITKNGGSAKLGQAGIGVPAFIFPGTQWTGLSAILIGVSSFMISPSRCPKPLEYSALQKPWVRLL